MHAKASQNFLFSGKRFVQNSFKKSDASARCGGESGFQFVAQRHHFVQLRHNTVLFPKGWDSDYYRVDLGSGDDWLSCCVLPFL